MLEEQTQHYNCVTQHNKTKNNIIIDKTTLYYYITT